jgi:hypothetical protein
MDGAGAPPLGALARDVDAALADLARVASAARHGDQLAAVIVDAHAAGFRRLLELAEDPAVLTGDPALAELSWVHEVAGDGAAIETMAARVETLRASIEQAGVPGLVHAADRLVEALTELYGWALARAVELLHDSGQRATLMAALDDALVGALLLSHGMHPEPLAERVGHVVAACTTTLGHHAGAIEIVSVSEGDGRVHLRAHEGDQRQRWRTRLAVERAIRELVPDVIELVVDGADAEPRGTPAPTTIPVTSIGRRRTTRWAIVPELAELPDGAVTQVSADGVALVACRVGTDWFVAADPFTTNSLRMVATDPPTVEAGDGTRLVFDDPWPTHVDGGVVEVALR